MGFFKSFTRGANKFFKKGEIGKTKVFGKGSVLSKGLGDVSKGITKAGGVLGSVAKVASSVINNPLVQTGLMALGPEASIGANALTAGLGTASSALKQGGQLTKQSTYSGNPSQVANNILERASGIANTVSPKDAVASGSGSTVSSGGSSYTMM